MSHYIKTFLKINQKYHKLVFKKQELCIKVHKSLRAKSNMLYPPGFAVWQMATNPQDMFK